MTESVEAVPTTFMRPQFQVSESSEYQDSFDALIACSDSLAFLKTIPDDTAHLIVSSPPYNIGKPYEKRSKLDDYLARQEAVLEECVRVLHPEGSLCWEVGNHVQSGEVFPLDVLFYQILKEKLGLKLRNRIIWSFEHGLHARKRFSGRYETILWFTKSDSYYFDLDPARVPQKYPGKRHHKGPKKGEYSGNPLGKNPGDIWKVLKADWDAPVWDIPNVKWNHPEKTAHPAQFPVELVERLVLPLTRPGDIVIDPYMGAGSSLIAALLHERKAIGIDKDSEYVTTAKARLEALRDGTLKRRSMTRVKYQPSGEESISKRPPEWDTPKASAPTTRRLLEKGAANSYADRS